MKVDDALRKLDGDRDRVRALRERDPAGLEIQLTAIDLVAGLEDRPEVRQAVETIRRWIEGGAR